MYIREVTLQDFKAFGPIEQVAPLGRRLTLICGFNSSGKSSIVQSLLALQQSWATEPDFTELRTQGERVQLGRFGNVVHEQGQGGAEGITIGVSGESRPTADGSLQTFGPVRLAYDGYFYVPQSGQLPALPWNGTLREAIIHSPGQKWSLTSLGVDDQDPGRQRMAVSRSFWNTDGMPSEDSDDAAILARLLAQENPPGVGMLGIAPRSVVARVIQAVDLQPGRKKNVIDDNRFQATVTQGEGPLSVRLKYAFERHVLGAREAIFSIRHLAQTRSSGRRIYDGANETGRQHVGRHGGHVTPMLFDGTDLLRLVNHFLTDVMGTGVTIQPRELDTVDTSLELLIEPVGSSARLSLLDVGSGISQVLPIVVQFAHEVVQSRSRMPGIGPGIVWVEQPELHLHPRMQVGLLKTLIADEVDPDNAPQVVFETHSEVLVAAVQGLVSRGLLSPDDVKVLWVQRAGDDTGKIVDLLLGERGRFGIPWPEGKFTELYEIAQGKMFP